MAKPDLTKYDALQKAQNDGVEVKILDPKGQPTGITITVAGPDSEKQKAARLKRTDARIARKQAHPLAAADIELEGLQYLIGTIIRWSDFELDGQTLALTDANALALFQRYPWIAEQIDATAGSRVGFTEKSETDSSAPSETTSEG